MQYCVYITALQYGCEIIEAESEDEEVLLCRF
mgnify:CR=1 FL=1